MFANYMQRNWTTAFLKCNLAYNRTKCPLTMYTKRVLTIKPVYVFRFCLLKNGYIMTQFSDAYFTKGYFSIVS